jgi:hypothetical protein
MLVVVVVSTQEFSSSSWEWIPRHEYYGTCIVRIEDIYSFSYFFYHHGDQQQQHQQQETAAATWDITTTTTTSTSIFPNNTSHGIDVTHVWNTCRSSISLSLYLAPIHRLVLE